MRKLAIVLALATASLLAGCGDRGAINTAGAVVCNHRDETRTALTFGLGIAEAIKDPVKRETTIGALRASLAALGACPAPPAPIDLLPT